MGYLFYGVRGGNGCGGYFWEFRVCSLCYLLEVLEVKNIKGVGM